MNSIVKTLLLFLFVNSLKAQTESPKWYSEYQKEGIIIQNSYPKGGPYTGPTQKHYHYSYLVFYTRVENKSLKPIEINIAYSAEAIQIPKSPHTFMKLFLPEVEMRPEKINLFSYGITQINSFDEPTQLKKVIQPQQEAYFYTVALFYQTKKLPFNSERGGNRAEYFFDGNTLKFSMCPQVEALSCGYINLK